MKIECPNCKLSGEINEHEVPLEGRYIDCPKCRTGFHVKKPLGKGWNPNMMNTCPDCGYSTFTDEVFEVCPKCGLHGRTVQERKKKQKEPSPPNREPVRQPTAEETAQAIRDMERLNRSYRSDDFIQAPTKKVEAEEVAAPPAIRFTGWGVLAVACLVVFYGIVGLMAYHGQDLQAKINETALEPVSSGTVFLRYGLLPWVLTIYGGLLAMAASQFLRLRIWTLKGLELLAWAGVAIGVVYEIADFMAYVKRASDSPTVSYYLVGIVTSLFMLAVWVALPLALIWWLRDDRVTGEFPPEQ
jgi:predicted Zn finger-like uncharacterized protein